MHENHLCQNKLRKHYFFKIPPSHSLEILLSSAFSLFFSLILGVWLRAQYRQKWRGVTQSISFASSTQDQIVLVWIWRILQSGFWWKKKSRTNKHNPPKAKTNKQKSNSQRVASRQCSLFIVIRNESTHLRCPWYRGKDEHVCELMMKQLSKRECNN